MTELGDVLAEATRVKRMTVRLRDEGLTDQEREYVERAAQDDIDDPPKKGRMSHLDIALWSMRSRYDQGLPLYVEDPVVIERIAAIFQSGLTS